MSAFWLGFISGGLATIGYYIKALYTAFLNHNIGEWQGSIDEWEFPEERK